MVHYIAVPFSVEIEERMIGKIDYRGFIRFRTIRNDQLVIIGEPILYHHREPTWETFLAISSNVIEVGFFVIHYTAIPHPSMETTHATMQCIGTIVWFDMERFTFDGKAAVCNTVCKPPSRYTMINFVRTNVLLNGIESQYHISR